MNSKEIQLEELNRVCVNVNAVLNDFVSSFANLKDHHIVSPPPCRRMGCSIDTSVPYFNLPGVDNTSNRSPIAEMIWDFVGCADDAKFMLCSVGRVNKAWCAFAKRAFCGEIAFRRSNLAILARYRGWGSLTFHHDDAKDVELFYYLLKGGHFLCLEKLNWVNIEIGAEGMQYFTRRI